MGKKLLVISAVWCPSCLIINKYLKKIQEIYNTLYIVKLDYDLDEEIIEKYLVGSILPVLIFLDDNEREVGRLIGEKSYEEISEFIEKNL